MVKAQSQVCERPLQTCRHFLTAINPENGVVCLLRVGAFLFTASLQLANYMGEFK